MSYKLITVNRSHYTKKFNNVWSYKYLISRIKYLHRIIVFRSVFLSVWKKKKSARNLICWLEDQSGHCTVIRVAYPEMVKHTMARGMMQRVHPDVQHPKGGDVLTGYF